MLKQDLIQVGFQVAEKSKSPNKFEAVIEQRKDYFNEEKRQVILGGEVGDLEDHNVDIEEIKEDF